MNSTLYLGVMSGTSLDGIDIALVDFANHQTQCLAFKTYPYPESLKQTLNEFNSNLQVTLAEIAHLEKLLGCLYAEKVNQFLSEKNISSSNIVAIGNHGQTIFHDPNIPMSLQIGHPAFIAKKTGITTVADFRIDDMANGGQGAPLAPLFHQHIFKLSEPTLIANIGGIANISYFDPQASSSLIGYDTGPGNGLMDDLSMRFFKQPYDIDGNIAASSTVNNDLLNTFLSDDYFQMKAPKSTGRDYFNHQWLERFPIEDTSHESLMSTLNQLTVETLALAIKALNPKTVILCGGGAENVTLRQRLAEKISARVQTSWDYGIDPNAIEAMMMAWLAHQRLTNQPLPLQKITGAQSASISGGIWAP